MTYDETFTNFYLWTANNDICALKLDSLNSLLEISDCDQCRCPYPDEYGWTTSAVTFDENDGSPRSMVGPFGYDWEFTFHHEHF